MRISPIQTNNFFVKNQNKVNYNYFNRNNYITDSVSFKGEESSKEYSNDEIFLARQALYLDEQEWKDFIYRDRYKYQKDNRPEYTLSYAGHEGFEGFDEEDCKVTINMNKITALERILFAVSTLGASEVKFHYENAQYRQNAKKWIEKIDLIRTEILNTQADEKAAELKKQTLKQQREAEQINETSKVKEEKLYPQLLNLIQREKEGKKTKIPNCVMLSNTDDKINKELIKWCGENVNGQFITTDPNEEDLIDVLEEAEVDYQESGNWNLIYVEDMDELINSNYSDDSVISSMKDIMTDCAEVFHSTLIFSAPHPEKLDDIAIAPHRVKKIDTSNVKPAISANIDDAKARLNNEEYKKQTPISAINDILFLLGANKDMFLTANASAEDIEKAGEFIKGNDSKEDNYSDLFDKLSKNIWYYKDIKMKKEAAKVENTKTTTVQPKGLQKVLGMDKLKAELVDSVIEPLKNQKYQEYDIDPISGVLLYGPPGCGKTYIIKALAEELGRYFIEIKPSDVGSIYINGTPNNIKEKFEEAKNNAPSIIFIDEIEALAPSRNNLSGADNETNKCVTELLTQFNEAKDNGIFIICASNEPQKIDKAIKRTGRLDKKIYVPEPDIETRKAFINDKLKRIKVDGVNVDVDLIAQNTEYYTAEDIKILMQTASIKAIKEGIPLNTELLLETIKEYKPDLNKLIVEEYRRKGDL